MKIISFNINGIRSVIQKGFLDWLNIVNPDLVCLQETKIDQSNAEQLSFEGYHSYWHSATKKGYSGTAILSKVEPVRVIQGIGHPEIDSEGRVMRIEFEQFSVWSCYFPSGASAPERQNFKLIFLDVFQNYIEQAGGNHIVTGDFNLCHTAADIHNPIRLNGVPGFTSEEREWMTRLLSKLNLIDTYRHLNPTGKDIYSWWSYMAKAKAKNAGWRIDYQLCSNNLLNHLQRAVYLKEVNFSDHCPLLTEWEGLSTT